MGKKKKDDGLCPICGAYMEARCTGFAHSCWVDGRTYEAICDCCRTSIKTCEFVDNQWFSYDYMDAKLHTLEEMIAEGWPKNQAMQTLKGVKKALKNRKK